MTRSLKFKFNDQALIAHSAPCLQTVSILTTVQYISYLMQTSPLLIIQSFNRFLGAPCVFGEPPGLLSLTKSEHR